MTRFKTSRCKFTIKLLLVWKDIFQVKNGKDSKMEKFMIYIGFAVAIIELANAIMLLFLTTEVKNVSEHPTKWISQMHPGVPDNLQDRKLKIV